MKVHEKYINTYTEPTIHIFKTNIKTKKSAKVVSSILNTHFSIIDCSVDTDDIDNVLRIVSTDQILEDDVINMLNTYGFKSELLAD